VAKEYYSRTKIFPIMHLVGVRTGTREQHPWLCGAVLKAFEQAKKAALIKLSDTSATKVTLPFVEEQMKAARDLMGEDYWSYGVGPNRHVLEAFCSITIARAFRPGSSQGGRAVSPGHDRRLQDLISKTRQARLVQRAMSWSGAMSNAATKTERPPFRADHVGSLLRPQRLRQARETLLGAQTSDRHLGPHDNAELRAIEDECIRDVIAHAGAVRPWSS
jgi:hypothetical protein